MIRSALRAPSRSAIPSSAARSPRSSSDGGRTLTASWRRSASDFSGHVAHLHELFACELLVEVAFEHLQPQKNRGNRLGGLSVQLASDLAPLCLLTVEDVADVAQVVSKAPARVLELGV